MNFDQARINMIKQQIQPWGVFDDTVLQALQQLPREEFVPSAYKKFAFTDMPIPLNDQQQMMTPKEEARLLQAVQIKKTDKILEIGTGSGYLTALLARLGEQVYSFDIDAALSREAAQRLQQCNIDNVSLLTQDGVEHWHERSPYDVIVLSGAVKAISEAIKQALMIGGRLFAVVGKAPAMTAILLTRLDRHEWQTQHLFETVTSPLINTAHTTTEETFVF